VVEQVGLEMCGQLVLAHLAAMVTVKTRPDLGDGAVDGAGNLELIVAERAVEERPGEKADVARGGGEEVQRARGR
jgi:hypothetical protein